MRIISHWISGTSIAKRIMSGYYRFGPWGGRKEAQNLQATQTNARESTFADSNAKEMIITNQTQISGGLADGDLDKSRRPSVELGSDRQIPRAWKIRSRKSSAMMSSSRQNMEILRSNPLAPADMQDFIRDAATSEACHETYMAMVLDVCLIRMAGPRRWMAGARSVLKARIGNRDCTNAERSDTPMVGIVMAKSTILHAAVFFLRPQSSRAHGKQGQLGRAPHFGSPGALNGGEARQSAAKKRKTMPRPTTEGGTPWKVAATLSKIGKSTLDACNQHEVYKTCCPPSSH
ncbi:hypothetical protein P153DRAFT_352784 [Dothidotthia symphoricarpi CBS 119687]|uniref:Uncharacterized protein n=1 Tax=Dothidotthia symphoricarpi CBS 119687 TaxID=1392245 RepID=A0A6A6AV82_9PLEO|nr:uncharacterized protein P153DRAFT_352784 [Dothidotthia symphoricarpi CBS 119687]KAF2134854.1 hypothetical protein P153DRAFT_352784 [Dothidotthia symphoricarpi CBS 119687]